MHTIIAPIRNARAQPRTGAGQRAGRNHQQCLRYSGRPCLSRIFSPQSRKVLPANRVDRPRQRPTESLYQAMLEVRSRGELPPTARLILALLVVRSDGNGHPIGTQVLARDAHLKVSRVRHALARLRRTGDVVAEPTGYRLTNKPAEDRGPQRLLEVLKL